MVVQGVSWERIVLFYAIKCSTSVSFILGCFFFVFFFALCSLCCMSISINIFQNELHVTYKGMEISVPEKIVTQWQRQCGNSIAFINTTYFVKH